MQAFIGLLVFIIIAYLLSSNKSAINLRLVIGAILLQITFCLMITKIPFMESFFNIVGNIFVRVIDFSNAGAQFLFGDLAKNSNVFPDTKHNMGYIFVFNVMPTIIYFSAITGILYYWGILQKVVVLMAKAMSKVMPMSGAESLSAAGNVFLGQTEAPLLIKPFLEKMTKSEIMCVMTCGMATIAGGVMAAYVGLLGGFSMEEKSKFAAHLINASLMNTPAAIMFSKILLPETEALNQKIVLHRESFGVNIIDATCNGISDGLRLSVNVAAMLLGFVSLIALINFGLLKIGNFTHLNDFIVQFSGNTFQNLSLEYIFGTILRPLAWLMGVSWHDSIYLGSLLGQKTAINEFIAYLRLADYKKMGFIDSHTILISTYALCGFSNFSSIAIQLGGIGSLAPNQRGNISKLGMRALLAASLACMFTGAMAGLIV